MQLNKIGENMTEEKKVEKIDTSNWRYAKNKEIEEIRKKSKSKNGTTTTETINTAGLSKVSKERVKDIAEDLKDDGKRNYSNKKKK